MVSGLFRDGLRRWRALGWREFVLLLSVGTVTAGLWLFVVLADEILEKGHHAAESRWMLALRVPGDLARPIGPAWVKEASLDISALGGVTVLTLITVLVSGYLLLRSKFAAFGLLVVTTLGGTLLNQGLKHFINRDRPSAVPHLAEVAHSSFPSGHSMLSAIVYLTLAVVVAQTLESRRAKVYVVVAALLVAFLVGVSRVIIGVHYPSDVLAGWTAGTAWAVLCWLAASWLGQRGMLRNRPGHKIDEASA